MSNIHVRQPVGLHGEVELIEFDLDGNELSRVRHRNALKTKLLEVVATSLIGGTVTPPSHIAVGNGQVDGYDFELATAQRVIDDGSEQLIAQQFSVGATTSIGKIRAKVTRIGFSAATLQVEIHADSSGSPSGTPVTNGITNPVAMNGFSADQLELQEFSFAVPPSLTSGTYWIVFRANDYAYVDDVLEIGIGIDFLDATENTAKKWNGSAWSVYGSGGDDSAFGFGVVAVFDVSRSTLRNELERNAIAGSSNPNPAAARFTVLFGPTEANGYISELGLLDAAVSGNLLAYTETGKEKTSQRVLMVIWTITAEEVVEE